MRSFVPESQVWSESLCSEQKLDNILSRQQLGLKRSTRMTLKKCSDKKQIETIIH